MSEKKEIGEIFLNCFVQELILFSKLAPEIEEEKIPIIKITTKPARNMLSVFTTSAQKGHFKIPQIIQSNQREKFSPSRKTEQEPISHSQPNDSKIPAMEKLNFLIRDPAVTEIECAGSDKPILVKKADVVQRTKAILSIEEIYELIAEFSQKTKIPVIEGTFKAALDNLILTAILSETLGPRFILQKKNPFQEGIPK